MVEVTAPPWCVAVTRPGAEELDEAGRACLLLEFAGRRTRTITDAVDLALSSRAKG